MTKQAPLPWTLTQNSWQYTTIYDADGSHVCRLDLEDWSVTEENQDELEKVQTQIASRIVKAVNSHDAMVKALEEIADCSSIPISVAKAALASIKEAV